MYYSKFIVILYVKSEQESDLAITIFQFCLHSLCTTSPRTHKTVAEINHAKNHQIAIARFAAVMEFLRHYCAVAAHSLCATGFAKCLRRAVAGISTPACPLVVCGNA